MGAFDFLKVLQKPQSIAMGTILGMMREAGLDNDWNKRGKAQHESDQNWIQSLKTRGEDTSALEKEYLSGINSITGTAKGFGEGVRGDVSPSKIIKQTRQNQGQEVNVLEKILGTANDVILDPLVAGGSVVARAGKLGKAGKAAATYGKLEKGASVGEKGAQLGRRFQQGMSATGEPLSAAGTALLGGLAENKLAPRIRAITQMLQKTPGNLDDIARAESTLNPAALEMGRLFDPADVASFTRNTGVGSALDDVPTATQTFQPDLFNFGTQNRAQDLLTAKPSVEDELMRILSPKKPKVLIDPMIEDADIVSQILQNAGRRRG